MSSITVAEKMLNLLEKEDTKGDFSWMRMHFKLDGEDLYSATESANAIGVKIDKHFYDECIDCLDLDDIRDREIKEHLDEMLIA